MLSSSCLHEERGERGVRSNADRVGERAFAWPCSKEREAWYACDSPTTVTPAFELRQHALSSLRPGSQGRNLPTPRGGRLKSGRAGTLDVPFPMVTQWRIDDVVAGRHIVTVRQWSGTWQLQDASYETPTHPPAGTQPRQCDSITPGAWLGSIACAWVAVHHRFQQEN